MKEIKFRGKTKYGSWVYGYYFLKITEEGKPIHQIIENYSDLNRHNPGMKVNFHQVIPETVGQFIGLKDTNGKEIYEGDIIKNIFGELALIIYETPHYKLDYNINGQISNKKSIIWVDELKVIGNKYENPELLKGD